jgi:predicted glycoside hydrolase/deacetylase ChbG (UPF0249 family)
MKKLLLLIVVIYFLPCVAQQPRLIVRGDDMGYTHSGNLALIKCYRDGFQKSIEVIVPSPWFPEAVKMLKENPAVDVGVHLALTSEWENIKWRPVTNCKSLTDTNGYFFPMVYPNKNYPGQSIKENAWNIEDIEKEFRAQIEIAVREIPQVSHISGHMGCVNISEETKAVAKKLAAEYNIDIDLSDYGAEGVGYKGARQTGEEKINSFISMLETLQPGKTYLFVDHPGFDNAELQAVFHTGYEDVAKDRQGVTDLFTSKKVMSAIKTKGISIISYKDLESQANK